MVSLLIFLATPPLLGQSFPNQVTIQSEMTRSMRFFVRLHEIRDFSEILLNFLKITVLPENAAILRDLDTELMTNPGINDKPVIKPKTRGLITRKSHKTRIFPEMS